ncbi:glycosyltransferase [Maribellus sp. YY47]|uniref:glycosyltransferase n=1 Tax=Maribellus sp. YY47 TaxID=2929486 RepID=UPI0020017F14|nr:glycosyltransferase [Maribellus sp. YY47]MCK3685171.1 glycosyltransferase [Maribellus sp. YY47]
MDKPLVSVCMITYNHEPYIREAIEGVLKQKCNFPIELVIGEDCSTDNTRIICNDYAKEHSFIKLLPSDKNLGMLPNFFRTINNSAGKYIAICEGDDYWIDPYKLQKQVDFLETNPDYSLVYTKALSYNNRKEKYERNKLGKKLKNNDLLVYNPIATLTTLFRKKAYEKYLKDVSPISQNWEMGDYPMWLWMHFNSKIYFLPEVTAVYRVLEGSASRSSNKEKRYQYNLSKLYISNAFASIYCDYKEYSNFLSNRYSFLYLYCVKNNINREIEYVKKINELEIKTIKTNLIILLFHHLGISKLYHLIFK